MTLGEHLSLGLTAIAVGHGYLWFRLVHGVTRSRLARILGASALLVLASAILHVLLRTFTVFPALDHALTVGGFWWIGASLLLLLVTLLFEIPRIVAPAAARLSGQRMSPERRRVLGQMAGATAAALGIGVSTWGGLNVLNFRVSRIRVSLNRLPRAMSGTRIAQITDLHLGGSTGADYLARVVAETNALDADIVVITGDLVDGSVTALAKLVAPLRGLRARHGVYFVTGNHEYYYGGEDWARFLTSLGIRVLRNQRVRIGTEEASFDLAGVDDHSARYYGIGHGEDLAQALEGRDEKRAVVLLAHQPKTIFEAAKLGVDLQLSGHTHGGQIYPFGFAMYLEQPFIDGLHKIEDTQIYVSPGTGFWGPPMRVGARAEIAEITLVAGA